MSDDAYGATVAKRRLSRRLAELRGQTGYTANHVCDILNWGRGKVGRFEANQWKRPEMSDIRDLLRIYGVEQSERDELEDLAMQARVRPWWRDYPEVFENEFPGFENDAARINVFMPLLLPGLLQTADYVETFARTSPRPPAWRERAIETRKRRQEILERRDASVPELVAVITEASLLYRWGTQADRRDQVAHLAEMSRRPGVELRIQRFEDGPPQGLFSPINILHFSDDEPSIAFTETDTALQEVSDNEQVSTYIQSFDRAARAARDPAETTTFLEQLAQQLE
jgi:transcriptional regulator with XRE-family HTH domain